jgi:hypothetical protein
MQKTRKGPQAYAPPQRPKYTDVQTDQRPPHSRYCGGTEINSRALSGRRTGSLGSSMGLFVSIFAYLGAVTALVVGLLMSFDAFLYPSDQSTFPQQTITAPKPSAPHAMLTRSAKIAQSDAPLAEAPAPRPGTGADDTTAAVARSDWRQPRVHRLVRQGHGKNWAYQQEPNALGYAEEPSASFLYDRFQ